MSGTALRIKSDFALLDVTTGRNRLLKLVGDRRTPIPVTITGFIIAAWGNDDGTSREFSVDVTGVKMS